MARAERTPAELAKEFEPSAQTIRTWIKQAEIDAGERQNGLTNDKKAELTHLRRENRRLHLEREILAKAAVWFGR